MEGGRGQGLDIGGPNSQQAHDVITTLMRRNDVALTSFKRHVPARFLINQCQIITFLILKSDIIENSRIELRGRVLPVPLNQIKLTFIIILPFNLVHPSTWYICDFFLFLTEIEGKGGWSNGGGGGGGGGARVYSPSLSNYRSKQTVKTCIRVILFTVYNFANPSASFLSHITALLNQTVPL